MALHIEIEEEYASIYSPGLYNLFKKRGKGKVLGLTPCLIPCFSNPGMETTVDEIQEAALTIAGMQQWFAD